MTSNGSSSRSDWLSSNAPSLASIQLPRLTPFQPPPPPTFPDLFQLAEEAAQQTTPSPVRNEGLFAALIGDPMVLYQELLEDPERFDPEAAELLQLFAAGQKKLDELTPGERTLLDLAVIDFASPRTPPPKPELPPEPKKAKLPDALEHILTEQDAMDNPSVDIEWHEGGRLIPILDVPDEAPPTHWWRNR